MEEFKGNLIKIYNEQHLSFLNIESCYEAFGEDLNEVVRVCESYELMFDEDQNIKNKDIEFINLFGNICAEYPPTFFYLKANSTIHDALREFHLKLANYKFIYGYSNDNITIKLLKLIQNKLGSSMIYFDGKKIKLINQNGHVLRCCYDHDYFEHILETLYPNAINDIYRIKTPHIEFSYNLYDCILTQSIDEYLSMNYYNMYKHMLIFLFKDDVSFLNIECLSEELESKSKLDSYLTGIKKFVRRTVDEGFDENKNTHLKIGDKIFYLMNLRMKSNEDKQSINIFGFNIGRKQIMLWSVFVLSHCLQKSFFIHCSQTKDSDAKLINHFFSCSRKQHWSSKGKRDDLDFLIE
jgi:hypothetical protein